MAHPLDHAVWSALTGRQAALGEGGALARRFREDIGPFAAAADHSAEAVAALAALARANDDMSLLEPSPPAPPAGIELKSALGVQMTIAAFTANGGKPFSIEALSESDAADMLTLATLTRPGPFRTATHTLGRFVGIRDGARLVAMAGERLQPEGHIEISGVCTHPDYRGRGYGAALMRVVGDRILSEGLTPFLHAYASNTGAIALYHPPRFRIAPRSHARGMVARELSARFVRIFWFNTTSADQCAQIITGFVQRGDIGRARYQMHAVAFRREPRIGAERHRAVRISFQRFQPRRDLTFAYAFSAHRSRAHNGAAFDAMANILQHAAHDRRHAGHDEHIANLKSWRFGHRISDQRRRVWNARHPQTRFV